MFNGEIVFCIADTDEISVDFGPEMEPTKIVKKEKLVILGRKAPKNIWMYKIAYNGEKEYLEGLEKLVTKLDGKEKYINELIQIYDEVLITIYIRSEFGQIGYAIPNRILKKLSLIDCSLEFCVLSYGLVADD